MAFIGLRKASCKARHIWIWVFGVTYIRDFTVYIIIVFQAMLTLSFCSEALKRIDLNLAELKAGKFCSDQGNPR